MFYFSNPDASSQPGKGNVKGLVIKPYSVKELRQLYEVSPKTFRKWLMPFSKEIGERNGNFFSVTQVEIIFARLGLPYTITKKNKVKGP